MPRSEVKSIGIKDIAAMAQVSIGTVDRVIHNRTGVAPKTREKVLRLLDQHAYKKNILASRLKLASSRKIKLVALLPKMNAAANYWQLHMRGLNRALTELRQSGVTMEVCHFEFLRPQSFRREMRKLMKKGFDGVITVPFHEEEVEQLATWSAESRVPLAFLDSDTSASFSGFSTFQDSREAGLVAGRLMHSIVSDTSDMFVIQTSRNGNINSNALKRAEGFLAFFNGVEMNHRFTILQHRLEDQASLARTLCRQIKNLKNFGIFVTNSRGHLIAEILESHGLTPGKVIGFDLNASNIKYLKSGQIQFLINQKPEFQSYTAVMQLYQYLAQDKGQDEATHIRIPVEIVVPENVDFYAEKNMFAT